MNNPLLSLVIPVFNVAPYLVDCLNSLVAQTRPVDEIIVVDDGSTDACPEILASFAEKLPQMRVIRQENAGLSAARNTGMAHAHGRYLAFVDSDDFVAPHMYERMLAVAESEGPDMVVCNALYHFEGREAERPIYPLAEHAEGVISGAEWMRWRLKSDRLLHMVWMHLYRREYLSQHGFSFIPRLIHEDVIWTTEVLLNASRLCYLDEPLYHYRIPIRHFALEQNKRRLDNIIASSVINARTLLEISARKTVDPELAELLRWQAVDGAMSIFHKIAKISDNTWQKRKYRELREAGLFAMIWKNAGNFRQHRRIARHYLKCLASGGFGA